MRLRPIIENSYRNNNEQHSYSRFTSFDLSENYFEIPVLTFGALVCPQRYTRCVLGLSMLKDKQVSLPLVDRLNSNVSSLLLDNFPRPNPQRYYPQVAVYNFSKRNFDCN